MKIDMTDFDYMARKIALEARRRAVMANAAAFGVPFWEQSFLELYDYVFKKFGGEEQYEKLKKEVDDQADSYTKTTKSTVNAFMEVGKDLPIKADENIRSIITDASNLAIKDWELSQIGIKHLFIAFTRFSGRDCTFSLYFCGNEKLVNEIGNTLDAAGDPGTRKSGRAAENSNSKYNKREQGAYITDLIEKARHITKPFIGRDDVIAQSVQTLCRMDKSNPLYVGEPGVGKTSVVLGLAKKILDGEVPEKLKNAKLYSVDIAGMVAGTSLRGEFEGRLKRLLKVMEENGNVILFFDEIHTMAGAGSGSSGMDAANIIKPVLTEGRIKFIGATTYDEYRKYIERDKAFARRFQKIEVSEPSRDDAVKILDGLKGAYERFHGVRYTREAIEAVVDLSIKYIMDRRLPDKAVDLLDETGAYCSLRHDHGPAVTADDVEHVLTDIFNVKRVEQDKNNLDVVINLEERLNGTVFGQRDAAKALSKAIQKAKVGLGNPEKPLGSFLFVGPSGVGKTEMAKQLAKILGMHLIRLDMSEYGESHTASKLFGAPASYIGYEDGGLLTNEVMKHPDSVLLLDEIEKAHYDIYKTLLQVMDYGIMTDNKGKKVSFRGCIIIMTSNAGAHAAARHAIGFGESGSTTDGSSIMDAVKQTFPPEFRGRLDGIIVFNGINKDICRMIVQKELSRLDALLAKKQIFPEYTEECMNELVKRCLSAEYGAREVQNVIEDSITPLFVKLLLKSRTAGKYRVNYVDGNFRLECSFYISE